MISCVLNKLYILLQKQNLLIMKTIEEKTEKQLNLHVVISTFKDKVRKDLELLNKEYDELYLNPTELDLYDNNLNNRLDVLLGKIEVLDKTLNYL